MLRGKFDRKKLESLSYKTIILSVVMIFIGIAAGSFVKYVVYAAVFGSAVLLLGIIIYMYSQLIGDKTTGSVSSEEKLG